MKRQLPPDRIVATKPAMRHLFAQLLFIFAMIGANVHAPALAHVGGGQSVEAQHVTHDLAHSAGGAPLAQSGMVGDEHDISIDDDGDAAHQHCPVALDPAPPALGAVIAPPKTMLNARRVAALSSRAQQPPVEPPLT